jgi:hypothetical protein
MKNALKVEGEITEDGHLVVELPPETPRGRVVVTLELLSEDDLKLTEEDLRGQGRAKRRGVRGDNPASLSAIFMVTDGILDTSILVDLLRVFPASVAARLAVPLYTTNLRR